MTEAKPRQVSRATLANLLIVALIVILAPFMVLGWFWWQTDQLPQLDRNTLPEIPNNPSEVIALNAENATINTTIQHSGQITITVAGIVQAADNTYHDALYQFTDPDGLGLNTPIASPYEILIDGVPIQTHFQSEGHMSPFNPFHIYAFQYDLGQSPRIIEFQLNQATVPDLRGQYQLFIVSDSAP